MVSGLLKWGAGSDGSTLTFLSLLGPYSVSLVVSGLTLCVSVALSVPLSSLSFFHKEMEENLI